MKLEEMKLTNPYLALPPLCYDKVKPTPLQDAFLIHANPALAEKLNIDRDELDTEHFTDFVNGALKLEGSDPFAMCYAGHQFGFFVERLGDGRAVNIGSIETPSGMQHMQLKGAGLTKFSRDGDGRAVLRSSIREYLMSEAMHGLGIPTTRALALIGSGHSVYRGEWEKGAIVLRVSPSWVRFGTFEYFAHHQKFQELEALVDYAIAESYPHLVGEEDAYFLFFMEVVGRTAMLMAQWQAVGFNHGVMNTDNMSIHGLTIDYGPYAFLDDYDFQNICNHTDTYGRYSFGSQPNIGEWNLRALMKALSPLVSEERMAEFLGKNYAKLYTQHYIYRMGKKLGFDKLEDGDVELVGHLLGTLQGLSVDYTLFFRRLSHYGGDRKEILNLCLYHQPMIDWLDEYDKRLKHNTSTTQERHEKMKAVNPKYVLKNYMLQEAIDAAHNGDYSVVEQLFTVAQTPFDEHPEFERWAEATPDEFKNKKLSCSS